MYGYCKVIVIVSKLFQQFFWMSWSPGLLLRGWVNLSSNNLCLLMIFPTGSKKCTWAGSWGRGGGFCFHLQRQLWVLVRSLFPVTPWKEHKADVYSSVFFGSQKTRPAKPAWEGRIWCKFMKNPVGTRTSQEPVNSSGICCNEAVTPHICFITSRCQLVTFQLSFSSYF